MESTISPSALPLPDAPKSPEDIVQDIIFKCAGNPILIQEVLDILPIGLDTLNEHLASWDHTIERDYVPGQFGFIRKELARALDITTDSVSVCAILRAADIRGLNLDLSRPPTFVLTGSFVVSGISWREWERK